MVQIIGNEFGNHPMCVLTMSSVKAFFKYAIDVSLTYTIGYVK